MMKNICFLIGNINHSGGTERVTTIIANELAKKNKVFILSLSDGTKPFFEQDISIVNENLFAEPVSMRKYFISAVSKIRKYLINNKIDTLIVVDSISCVFTVPACVGLNINHICWEHFNLKVNLDSTFRSLGRWMAAKWCDRVVTLTERDKTFWNKQFNLGSTNKVMAIANPSPYELQDHHPSLDNKNILCVGRLTYQKGFDLLILTWAKTVEQLPGWKITIVGSGEDEQTLKQMALDLNVSDTIVFAGQQKNMDLFYRKASFFCMSSRFEGLPMVLLEAQSYGLPIVSFDCDTGPAEMISNDKNGILVDCYDLDKLSSALIKLSKCDDGTFDDIIQYSKQNIKKFEKVKIMNKWLSIV